MKWADVHFKIWLLEQVNISKTSPYKFSSDPFGYGSGLEAAMGGFFQPNPTESMVYGVVQTFLYSALPHSRFQHA